VNYTYVIERAAAQMVLQRPPRERRLLQAAFDQIAAAPFQPADFEERGDNDRLLFTRFFGPFSVTYWRDDAVKEIRIAVIFRD
jgi:hypothetical protein